MQKPQFRLPGSCVSGEGAKQAMGRAGHASETSLTFSATRAKHPQQHRNPNESGKVTNPPFSRNHRRHQACTPRFRQHPELDPTTGRAILNSCGSENQVPVSCSPKIRRGMAQHH